MLGKARFEPLDFSKLPASYHGEEKKQETVGNATVYSHREISKVSEQPKRHGPVFSIRTWSNKAQLDSLTSNETFILCKFQSI